MKEKGEEVSKKTRVDPEDGTVYEWDESKKAWFPMISEDFIALYQANYGFIDNSEIESGGGQKNYQEIESGLTTAKNACKQEDSSGHYKNVKEKKTEKGRKEKQKPAWFELEKEKNNNVYVTGLPSDITEEEFIKFMSKCGIIADDINTGKPKIKLYRNIDNNIKGDALCCYLKHESIQLAINLLDESFIREKNMVHVQQAEFKIRGEFDPQKRKRQLKNKKITAKQEKLLDWVDRDGDQKKHQRVVVIKNAFTPDELEEKPELILEIKSQLRTLGIEFGKVKRKHPEGVCSITFDYKENAEKCLDHLDGKRFRGRLITTTIWDGVKDYKNHDISDIDRTNTDSWTKFLGQDES